MFYRIQLLSTILPILKCCKLLSKLYLCSTEYSVSCYHFNLFFVVNCFQNCIFVLPNTANKRNHNRVVCCKLLSKLYLCSTEYSRFERENINILVVNCFQNCIFVLPNTANQQRCEEKNSCKLLSKLYLCSTEYSTNL